ncbi:MAG: thiamine phosphate synthase [Chryseobacterium sp.]|jgi:thiamine-phosphate pyrophosphorylase|uniref:thiamine phosphate synthase n=1 Tax=Chryseobacterium sp. TaxID=1871047 RepID=UPI0028238C8D|nr:thiamine phosphate synthase [Chryseobacterium sp.]MDR2237599.1 thiamine phosphate synthase [Chryseobacterium sp.]
MILIITPEEIMSGETDCINQLFQKGLDLLHIRKPFISRKEMDGFLSEIDAAFYPQLVLHSHYELADDYCISRFHFREAARMGGAYEAYRDKGIISTSVHDISAYNELGKEWEYAFISPVFPSISKKGYGEGTEVLHEIQHRNNPEVKLVALGGINQHNIREISAYETDGVALLGAIWESDDPLETFEKCRKNAMN